MGKINFKKGPAEPAGYVFYCMGSIVYEYIKSNAFICLVKNINN